MTDGHDLMGTGPVHEGIIDAVTARPVVHDGATGT
jgi:hypothetical protein